MTDTVRITPDQRARVIGQLITHANATSTAYNVLHLGRIQPEPYRTQLMELARFADEGQRLASMAVYALRSEDDPDPIVWDGTDEAKQQIFDLVEHQGNRGGGADSDGSLWVIWRGSRHQIRNGSGVQVSGDTLTIATQKPAPPVRQFPEWRITFGGEYPEGFGDNERDARSHLSYYLRTEPETEPVLQRLDAEDGVWEVDL